MPKIYGNPFCDFCATLKLKQSIIDQRAGKLNYRNHVKSVRAHQGVIINSYLTDNRTWIYEDHSKTFTKINYCPLCGALLRNRRQFGRSRNEKWDE